MNEKSVMKTLSKFSPDVRKQLKFYVYRLVDPRNGKTFYVGKGQGNRVFDHMNMALKLYKGGDDTKEYQTKESEKYDVIKAIHEVGLEVIPIIAASAFPGWALFLI